MGNLCFDLMDVIMGLYRFKEQVRWAASGGVDYIVAETFGTLGESLLALKAIQEFGNG